MLISNIEQAKDVMDINVRINVDSKNEQDILQLIDYFINDMGWGVNPYFYLAPVDNTSETHANKEKYMINMERFGELDTEVAKMQYRLSPDEFRNRLYPLQKHLYCGAERLGQYVVAPDGLLYSCWNKINVKDNNIGSVKTGPVYNYEQTKWLSLDLSDECKACTYLPCCQGGCAYFRINNKDNYACCHDLHSYKDKLKFVYENWCLSEQR